MWEREVDLLEEREHKSAVMRMLIENTVRDTRES